MSKIDLNNPPKYLRQATTGRIYAYSPFKAKRGDMEPYEMPEEPKTTPIGPPPSESAGDPQAAEPKEAVAGRSELIKAAIAQIPVEEFSKPAMGRPAIPKVAQVSELAGFKVTAEEIVAAVSAE